MITSQLLNNVRHRAMITTLSPLRTKAVERYPHFRLLLQYPQASGSCSETIWFKNQKKNIVLFV